MRSENPNPAEKKSNYYLENTALNKSREKIVLNRYTFVALFPPRERLPQGFHPQQSQPLINLNISTSQHLNPSTISTFSTLPRPDTHIMESIRQKQIGELIRRYFSMILSEEGINIYGRDKLVTLTGVKMTPDLLVAKLYISVYGTENKQEVILELEDNHTRLRQALASKVGKQMRRVPDIELFLDDTVNEMYRVDNLLNRVGDEDKNIGK